MSELKNQISQFIDTNAKVYQDISLAIHAKPEVSDFEYFASQTLSEQLKKEGFESIITSGSSMFPNSVENVTKLFPSALF